MSLKKIYLCSAAVGLVGAFAGAAIATPPPAGEVIGNQASATYEVGGETQTVTSNLVETVVNEVFGVDIEADQTKNAPANGGNVYFSHIVTNTGNADDFFDLTFTNNTNGAEYPGGQFTIYEDLDCDGVPDNATPITATPVMPAGGTYCIVTQVVVDAGDGDVEFDINATSDGDNTETDASHDILEVVTGGVVNLTKSQQTIETNGIPGIQAGDRVEVTITYTNVATAAANNVVVVDTFPTLNNNGDPIDIDYVSGSATWSETGAAALDDTGTIDGAGYDEAGTGMNADWVEVSANEVAVEIDSIPGSRAGQFTFQYEIVSAPEGDIVNIATVSVDGDDPEDSNPSVVEVGETINFVFGDAEGTTSSGGAAVGADTAFSTNTDSSTDDDGAEDDVVTEQDLPGDGIVFPGETLTFSTVLTNNSNGPQTFALSVDNTDFGSGQNFPAGTVFQFYHADGVTPIINNEVLLQGSDAALGGTDVKEVIIKAILPSGLAAGPVDYEAQAVATSVADPTVENRAGLNFDGEIGAPGVDIVNVVGGADVATGSNLDNGGNPWDTQTIDAAYTATFQLAVTTPAGQPNDVYNFAASGTNSWSPASLPAGWSVQFVTHDGTNCTTTAISSSPTVGNGGRFDYCAVVTVPSTQLAGDYDIFFQAQGSSAPANVDAKLDAVRVPDLVELEITTDQSSNLSAGGVTYMVHQITNNGNVAVTSAGVALGPDTFTTPDFPSEIFWDLNNNGVLDAGEPVATDISQIGPLAPGASQNLIVRVTASAGLASGATDTANITVDSTGINGGLTDIDPTNNVNTDTVTVVSGDVTLTKEQAVDATCDGTPDGAFTGGDINADPGMCLVYRITAQNTGFVSADTVVINDVIPNFTTYEDCGGACAATTSQFSGAATPGAVTPADESAGTVVAGPLATLPAGEWFRLEFTVQIDQ